MLLGVFTTRGEMEEGRDRGGERWRKGEMEERRDGGGERWRYCGWFLVDLIRLYSCSVLRTRHKSSVHGEDAGLPSHSLSELKRRNPFFGPWQRPRGHSANTWASITTKAPN